MSIFFHFRTRKFRLDERIANMISKVKSDNILPLLRPKNCRKRSQTGKLAKFVRFRPFFGRKRGQILSDYNFETRFGIPSSWRNFLTPNERKLITLFFWPPIVYPKLRQLGAHPYTSQIELKFLIQCFGTIRQFLRH